MEDRRVELRCVMEVDDGRFTEGLIRTVFGPPIMPLNWLRVSVAQKLLAGAKVEGNSDVRERCGQKNVWYFVGERGRECA